MKYLINIEGNSTKEKTINVKEIYEFIELSESNKTIHAFFDNGKKHILLSDFLEICDYYYKEPIIKDILIHLDYNNIIYTDYMMDVDKIIFKLIIQEMFKDNNESDDSLDEFIENIGFKDENGVLHLILNNTDISKIINPIVFFSIENIFNKVNNDYHISLNELEALCKLNKLNLTNINKKINNKIIHG
jgi:hypothetical protein